MSYSDDAEDIPAISHIPEAVGLNNFYHDGGWVC
jgi:hypothetical protein